MQKYLLSIAFVLFAFFVQAQNLTIYRSEKGVAVTVDKIVEQIKANKDLIFFEIVDHEKIAKDRGGKINPTQSILFEDPKLTTTLINCQQTVALDLPLEIIVWEANGDVYVAFMDPKFMKRRFMIQDCDETLEALSRMMIKTTMSALRLLK